MAVSSTCDAIKERQGHAFKLVIYVRYMNVELVCYYDIAILHSTCVGQNGHDGIVVSNM